MRLNATLAIAPNVPGVGGCVPLRAIYFWHAKETDSTIVVRGKDDGCTGQSLAALKSRKHSLMVQRV